MTRSEFIVVTALILFGAFLLGWIASWLVHRIGRAGAGELDHLARQLHAAKEERDAALALLQQRQDKMVAVEADHRAAIEALRDSRGEVEELRDYIEQRLTRR
nr:hypothetical protein [Paracoccus saliphilus]